MSAPTGPNFEVDQGTLVALALTPSVTPPVGSSAVLKVGSRPSVRDDYETVATQPLSVSGGTVSGTLDTSTLTGLQYLWQADLLDSAGALIQRWRGLLLITLSLP